jgi:hypothetical protein
VPRLTTAEIDALLAEEVHLRIATLLPDGSPYVVPCGFVRDGDTIFVMPRGASRWYANIARDPRVAVTIDAEQPPTRRINVSGVRATVVFEPGREGEWLEVARRIAVKGLGEAAVDHYLAVTGHLPRALVSFPFTYPAPGVTTWRPEMVGDDLTKVWPTKFGAVKTDAHADPAAFARYAPPREEDDRDGA